MMRREGRLKLAGLGGGEKEGGSGGIAAWTDVKVCCTPQCETTATELTGWKGGCEWSQGENEGKVGG